MPRIILNYQAAAELGKRYGLHTAEATAGFLGVDIEHVRYVCEHHGYPSDEFIAACLRMFPIRFDDLFEVVTDSFDVSTPHGTSPEVPRQESPKGQ